MSINCILLCWHLLKLQLCHLVTFLIWRACLQSLQSIMQVILQCLSCKLWIKVSHFTISVNYLLLHINKNQLDHLLIVIAIDCKMQVVGLLSMVLKCKYSTIYHCLFIFYGLYFVNIIIIRLVSCNSTLGIICNFAILKKTQTFRQEDNKH